MRFNCYCKNKLTRIFQVLPRSPARISVVSYAAFIGMGTFLLLLPLSSANHKIAFMDALFTAASATCVTGLSVLDIGSDLSIFGQSVVMLLMQVGGVGIMAFSTFFLLLAGKKVSLSGAFALQEIYSHREQPGILSILKNVALFTLIIEGLGMILIFCRFFPDKPLPHALFISAFHAISAFCNAGFSLFSENFMGFQNDFLLNFVICILVISGGLGFVVLTELKARLVFWRQRPRRFSLHTKLVISATICLLLFSTLLILIMEWNNTLSQLPFGNRLLAAFFHAVSARTAGFNTLPIGGMANETLFFLMLLMFIGAAPGSCGGGIKITTFASMMILGISKLRGVEHPQLFQRTISDKSMFRGISLVMVSLLIVIAGIMLIQMTELGHLPHPMSRGKFLELSFEVFSAFGTAGLSTGITESLSDFGKLIIIVVMFIGRIGPLMVAIAVSYRQKPVSFRYAEEDIMIG